MIVVIDNTTSTKRFLPKLIKYLEARNVKYKCVRSVEELERIDHPIHGFILSGSSAQVQTMTSMQWKLNATPLAEHVPVLGICLGAQVLQTWFGGRLKALKRTYCKNFKVHSVRDNDMAFTAKFCNKYVFDVLATDLEPVLEYTVEGERRVCAFRHKKKDVFGVLFHPEDAKSTWPILDAFVGKTLEHSRLS